MRLALRTLSVIPERQRRTRGGERAHRLLKPELLRGFTLVELLAVVAMISVLAALAMPSLIGVMRDRRVNRSANMIGEMYRLGRSRALGRGAATLVRWTATGGTGANGQLEMREAVVDATNNPVPSSSCLTTNWTNGATQNRLVARQETSTPPYELADVKMRDEANAIQAFGEICFSPRGRTFVRYDSAAAFAPLTGVPRFEVTNKSNVGASAVPRIVYVPPNGIARIQL